MRAPLFQTRCASKTCALDLKTRSLSRVSRSRWGRPGRECPGLDAVLGVVPHLLRDVETPESASSVLDPPHPVTRREGRARSRCGGPGKWRGCSGYGLDEVLRVLCAVQMSAEVNPEFSARRAGPKA